MAEPVVGATPGQPVMPPGGQPVTPSATPPAPASPPPAGGSPQTPPAGTAATPQPPAAGAGAGTTPPVPETPVWPEKFMRDGKPDTDALLTSYRELERAQFKRREDLKTEARNEVLAERNKEVPPTPADYTYTPIKLKDGRELQLETDNPLYQFMASTAHELKVPQAQFQKYVEQFAMAQLASNPSWTEEATKLGENAEVRLERLNAWGKGNLSQKAYDALSAIPATASVIEFFEEIMELTGEPKFAPVEGGGYKEKVTIEDLKAMQNDPRYWDPGKREKAWVDRVKAGYRKLNGT